MIDATDVATNIGRTLTSTENATVNKWITSARTIIQARLGDLTVLDQDVLDYVVLEAVTMRFRNPDGASTREVAIDDGRVSTRWEKSTGLIEILPEWWDMLTPTVSQTTAFTIRPHYEPDHAWR